MDDQIQLNEDWQVRSTFSGAATPLRSVVAAEAHELTTICIVDRARGTTGWVRDFVEDCRAAGRETSVEVNCAVEASLLDTNGTLDAPRFAAELADFVFIADHQLPTPRGPLQPEEAFRRILAGKLLPAKAIEWLVRASVNAVKRYDNAVLVHPFSLLPKLGLDTRHLHPAYVRWLAGAMADQGARMVISECLRCPEPWITGCFLAAGAAVHVSTGSRSPATVGRYEWCREVVDEIAGSDRSPALLARTRQMTDRGRHLPRRDQPSPIL